MKMTERLTSLARVKDWLNIAADNTASDVALLRLIDSASQFILTYISRDSFAVREYQDYYNGNGHSSLLLRHWPVVKILEMDANGVSIGAATFTNNQWTDGYQVGDDRGAPQSLSILRQTFYRGTSTRVLYQSGYLRTERFKLTMDEDAVHLIVPELTDLWIEDEGVVNEDTGLAMVSVDLLDYEKPYDSSTIPAGHYLCDEGQYLFSPDDVGTKVQISYSYVPTDIAQAVTEMVGEATKRKERIGVLSKNLGGQESVTFSKSSMNDTIRECLQPYMSVVPV
jgi:hypothetical protein